VFLVHTEIFYNTHHALLIIFPSCHYVIFWPKIVVTKPCGYAKLVQQLLALITVLDNPFSR
jgi:hypothetical protein